MVAESRGGGGEGAGKAPAKGPRVLTGDGHTHLCQGQNHRAAHRQGADWVACEFYLLKTVNKQLSEHARCSECPGKKENTSRHPKRGSQSLEGASKLPQRQAPGVSPGGRAGGATRGRIPAVSLPQGPAGARPRPAPPPDTNQSPRTCEGLSLWACDGHSLEFHLPKRKTCLIFPSLFPRASPAVGRGAVSGPPEPPRPEHRAGTTGPG